MIDFPIELDLQITVQKFKVWETAKEPRRATVYVDGPDGLEWDSEIHPGTPPEGDPVVRVLGRLRLEDSPDRHYVQVRLRRHVDEDGLEHSIRAAVADVAAQAVEGRLWDEDWGTL